MPTAKIRFRPESDQNFRHAVTARAEAYFTRTGGSRLADLSIYAKAGLFAALMAGCYAALLANLFGALGSFALAIAYGLFTLFLVINVAHDASHVALTGNRRIDHAVCRALLALVGIDGYLWTMRHDGSHHVFPNVNGCDADIDENPVLRLSPNHPRKPFQRWQHLYASFVYTLTLAHSLVVNDFVYLAKTELANMRGITHKPRDVAILYATKAFYVTLNIVLPLAFIRLPWWQILMGYAAMSAVMSLAFIFLLVGTHFSTKARYPVPGPDGYLGTTWAVHVMETSVDWLPGSRVAMFFSGGANAHAAHHFFPRVSHRHNRALTRIIRDTAREFGVRYNETSFFGVIALHFRHLHLLAQDEPASPAQSWQ